MDASRIEGLLPAVYREANQPESVLDAVLAVMEALHAPAEAALASLDAAVDPRRADDAFLQHLATWLALEPYLHERDDDALGGRGRLALDFGNLRELVLRAADFARLRGTRDTLVSILEIVTGLRGFTVEENPPDEDGRPEPFHIRLIAPAQARDLQDVVARVVAREKPAFTTCDVIYADG